MDRVHMDQKGVEPVIFKYGLVILNKVIECHHV